MAVQYPKNPRFHKLVMRPHDCSKWQEGCAHDPSLLEWQGKYYAYSTDTFGAPGGYQIRVSEDLLHWEYVGSAFNTDEFAPHYKKGEAIGAYGNFQEAFDWCITTSKEASVGVCTRPNGSMGFWAPHCVLGADGKFWLYFCLTGYFGGSKSCIGLAKSNSPTGGFECVGLLVQSPAGWRTPNAIDPQFFSAKGRSYLIYGSFGLGLHIIELDPKTGLRKDGLSYADFAEKRVSFSAYYGTCVARGSVEGGVVQYHENVPVFANGKWGKKNYYYLMCSFGSLSSVYNMRCGRSESPFGPYVDVNGNELVCSTDIGTGNKMLGSFRWEEDAPDFFCPGHNDMFVTADGVKLISYHCRTNYFIEKNLSRSNNFHYLYLGQYDFNSDGWPVMNANRYAGEKLQPVTKEELLSVSGGRFEFVLFTQSASPVQAKRVTLREDGTLGGALRGNWKMYGSHYIAIATGGDEYLGVVMPTWFNEENTAGLTVTAMGRVSGMALHMNSTKNL